MEILGLKLIRLILCFFYFQILSYILGKPFGLINLVTRNVPVRSAGRWSVKTSRVKTIWSACPQDDTTCARSTRKTARSPPHDLGMGLKASARFPRLHSSLFYFTQYYLGITDRTNPSRYIHHRTIQKIQKSLQTPSFKMLHDGNPAKFLIRKDFSSLIHSMVPYTGVQTPQPWSEGQKAVSGVCHSSAKDSRLFSHFPFFPISLSDIKYIAQLLSSLQLFFSSEHLHNDLHHSQGGKVGILGKKTPGSMSYSSFWFFQGGTMVAP